MATLSGPDSRASQATRFENTQRSSSSCSDSQCIHLIRVTVKTHLYPVPTRRFADSSPELFVIPTWGNEAGRGRKPKILAETTETTETTL